MKKLVTASAAVLCSMMIFAQETSLSNPEENMGNLAIQKGKKKNTIKMEGVESTTRHFTANQGFMPAKDTVPDTGRQKTTVDTTATIPTVLPDRVMMTDDKMVVIKSGDTTLLKDSIELESGAVVKNDGTVIFKSGSTAQLKNGQYIAISPVAVKKDD